MCVVIDEGIADFAIAHISLHNILLTLPSAKEVPAPLNLCYLDGFDLKNDNTVCPPERIILNDFYEWAKGGEWTVSDDWAFSQNNHCHWYGVECNEEGAVIKLTLASNGLSGKLNNRISELRSLEVLDISDNDIKVCAGVCRSSCDSTLPWTTTLRCVCFRVSSSTGCLTHHN